MSNGNITVEQAQAILKGKSIAEQLAFLYQAVANMSHTCQSRVEICDNRYVKMDWLKAKILIVIAFAVGLGFTGGWGLIKLIGLL